MRKHLKSRGRPYTYEKNTSTATSFPGTRVEKTWSGELGALVVTGRTDGKKARDVRD